MRGRKRKEDDVDGLTINLVIDCSPPAQSSLTLLHKLALLESICVYLNVFQWSDMLEYAVSQKLL